MGYYHTLSANGLGHGKPNRITYHTDYHNTGNSNFSLFSSIKRSSLVRSDDAVETFKRHKDDEISTACCDNR